MALATYSDLTTAIASWLHRSDATFTGAVGDLVTLAEAAIYRRLRVREMETATDLTISSQSTALPSGFIGARRLYISTNPLTVPEFLAPSMFWKKWAVSTTGKPENYTIEGDNLTVGPTPDSTYTGKLLFWKRLDPLSLSVNSLFTRNPDLWLSGSLAMAVPYIEDDERAQGFVAWFERCIDSVTESDGRDRFNAPAIRAIPDTIIERRQ